ncbi:hypothetical protein IKJ53_07850 [bacterium]|nr:hypothetical protein [bacterium]
MENSNLVFEQYKLYSEQKENFITRSFGVNRFYLGVVILLVLLAPFTRTTFIIGDLSLSAILCVVGMCTSVLWWMNMDAYNMLIKIKFSKVLEVIERQLPVQPYADEYKGIQDYRNNKKMFLFSDVQKIFAVIVFIIFFATFLQEIAPLIFKQIL